MSETEHKTCTFLPLDYQQAVTHKTDIGGVFAVDVSRDLGYCGHVYSIMTLDESNNIPEPIDLADIHQSVKETVILCDDGTYL